MSISLESRIEKMLYLRRKGYNCAQSLILCFPDITDLDDDIAAKLSSALGTGVGGTREICGAVNAMAIVEGFRHGSSPEEKVIAMKEAGELCRIFAEDNSGRLRCADLKGKEGIRPCNDLIAQAIVLLHNKYFA